jgi:hypothetical protein
VLATRARARRRQRRVEARGAPAAADRRTARVTPALRAVARRSAEAIAQSADGALRGELRNTRRRGKPETGSGASARAAHATPRGYAIPAGFSEKALVAGDTSCSGSPSYGGPGYRTPTACRRDHARTWFAPIVLAGGPRARRLRPTPRFGHRPRGSLGRADQFPGPGLLFHEPTRSRMTHSGHRPIGGLGTEPKALWCRRWRRTPPATMKAFARHPARSTRRRAQID